MYNLSNLIISVVDGIRTQVFCEFACFGHLEEWRNFCNKTVTRCLIKVWMLEGTGTGRLRRAKPNIWSWEQEGLEFNLALLLVGHVIDGWFALQSGGIEQYDSRDFLQ